MLKRNMSVKTAPQRWQENAEDGCFDVVLCFEDRVFDSVVDGNLFSFVLDSLLGKYKFSNWVF